MDTKLPEIEQEHIEIANTDNFDCCSKFMECSDAKKCVVKDDYAVFCRYREKLMNGICFYGKSSPNFPKNEFEKYENAIKHLSEQEKRALCVLCYYFSCHYDGLYIDTRMLHALESCGFISISKDYYRILSKVVSYSDIKKHVKESENYKRNFPRLNSEFSVLAKWLITNNSDKCSELTAPYCIVKPQKGFDACFQDINYYCLKGIEMSSPDVTVCNAKVL